MARNYQKNEFINKIDIHAENINLLYKAKSVNYKGTINDSNCKEFYSEIISEYLINHFDLFKQIQTISRDNYKIDKHNGKTKYDQSNRIEERIALSLFGKIILPIGKIIDYQVPIKKTNMDKAGKIDLVSFNENTGVLYLIELKSPKSKETLLRSILEILTYYKMVNIENLIKSYDLDNKCSKVKICSIFFENSFEDKEYSTFYQRPNFCNFLHKINDNIIELDLLRFSFDDINDDSNDINYFCNLINCYKFKCEVLKY